MDKEKPKVDLSMTDGNAFGLIAACRKPAIKSGWLKADFEKFSEEATKGDYQNVLRTIDKYFEVEWY